MNEYIITENQLKTAMEACLKREIPLPITNVFISGDKLPEIVRCRDCIRLREIGPVLRCEHVGRFVRPDYFCMWGERRDA